MQQRRTTSTDNCFAFPAVSAEDGVREAVELLTDRREALLVNMEGRAAGILTRADLLESLAR